ncbi:23S rRNA (adenine(2503)-C(2))-methyltransferase RlmN [Acetohalobium arabaticum]|uniref:Probable dual-specificity RNA methyltransferase RlmN n=1 Tax=Acetohalobium arabaticum (strain ATCC 49924 / DSM 5501 / Z-7288) TaxID=574087 RepID=D9QR05_ACEAZ|nr:23S rRNA (adenine(2503)-C(2))-methyltransferase RlmN [Acetohalobium arabaticum]ADL12946.1 23S rRNA m(2)A-2503 methyltransferase [Acetohalobium arabaticum DSM 5501]
MTDKAELISFDLTELENFINNELGEASFRAEQIFNWIYKQGAVNFEEMTNLSQGLRSRLQSKAYIQQLTEITRAKSEDGTVKFLFELEDNKEIETVFLPYQDGRNSICVSTQVGCGMGCNFCATGQQGLERNLTTGEIVSQILKVQQLMGSNGYDPSLISNVVFMGMGEPLANYDNFLRVIDILNSEKALNISMRRITVSTCGLVPQIKRLADKELQLVLAISLHAAEDKLRSEMMPINKRYPLEELIAACEYYLQKTNRRITFEYALVDGVNNRRQDAEKLAQLLSGLLCHVNLIPVNPVKELGLTRPNRKAIKEFKEILDRHNIQATVRQERGNDIEAACGQLRTENS